ncbi:hypothetical protein H6F78_08400 [Coleofasciculus sp. FACHB-64]|uniref:hypothetical protein n=1 Tax=Cyanophyceae TaxID=3028117 RepID=UPI001688DC94|nr:MULTISPECIES: hypothetical protein [unclassified Coleofasciculus]MBD1839310.1 hypothetical protein [Coleofasciculus sp. FACHB-501]MBD1901801.1 hypothetical protein [Coleofasciculus sp. FACHB-125]MBD1944405.1 hypothetical protein [Coleofasciculus sp. FACHB-712]MBD2045613.1 hypothetical protein [Coleofasciculus sp. FACHB-64]
MNYPDNKDNELQRRERELQERKRANRLREIEAEINQPPLHQTTKHQDSQRSPQPWYKKLANLGKFVAIVVTIVVSIQLAGTLSYVIIVGAVVWVAYKLFFESDHSKK